MLRIVIVLESFLVALLVRFGGSMPWMYWGGFLLLAVLSVAVFLVGLRFQGIVGGTMLAAGVLILVNLGTGLVPLSVILMGAVLALVQLVLVRLYRTHAADVSRRPMSS